jgi:hypothetical protein
MLRKSFLIAAVLLLSLSRIHAQFTEQYGSGLKVNLNQEGSKYVRFILWNQIWARYTQNNPGTMVNGTPETSTMDVGIRRARLLAFAQISPRYMIVTHFGINNQTFTNGGGSGSTGTGGYGQGKKPQLFFHDVYNEYAIVPAKNSFGIANKFTLSAGAGLHYFNGISRQSSASTLNFLMLDAPITNWPLIEMSDQFARQIGLFVKGTAGKVHFQFALNKPFATNVAPKDSAGIAVDNSGDPEASFSGYADYQFLDQESNVLPFRVGTYLGSKKVFNIGAGFHHQANGTRSSNNVGVIEKHAINIFGVDAFLDMPVGDKSKGMAITAYGVFYNYDFGPGYLRNSGTMNTGITDPAIPASDKVLEGPGNARTLVGTGSIVYAEAGFLLPKFSSKVRLQPMASFSHKNFDALNAAGNFFDIGCNVLLDAHNAKISAQYSSRPLYDAATKLLKDRKGEVVVQFQIVL